MRRRHGAGKTATVAGVCTAFAAATIGLAVSSHAGVFSEEFQSPSGDISCSLTYYPSKASRLLSENFVQCDIGYHVWAAPQPHPPDQTDYTSRFVLIRGQMPVVAYRQGTFTAVGSTLDYGQTQSAGVIACSSEPSAMRCTDVSTGHFFRVSAESYELG